MNTHLGKSDFVDQKVQQYILEATVREHPVLTELREETAKLPNATMEIGADQGAFMQLMARTIGAKRYLEIGVFTGYSALAVALALPDDGHVTACDVSEEYTAVARRYWDKAGVAHKIELRIAPAVETLRTLLADGVEPFDMAFIDADKVTTDTYYELALQIVRPGGLILVDNALQGGDVADTSRNDP
ncbi:MAG TPA: class I SAM-dependent methyltransferase, partial [Candidatus Tumulicola sp.]